MRWRFLSQRLYINDYVFLEKQSTIISRIAERSYGILIGGNYLEIAGNSSEQAIARLFTFIAVVICRDNEMSIGQALYLYEKYAQLCKVQSQNYYETVKWLKWMLNWQPETICFTYPIMLFDTMDYWQMLFAQISPGQYIANKKVQAVIVCETWKRYYIFWRGSIEEYALERNDKDQYYYLLDGNQDLQEDLTYEPIELADDEKLSDYLKQIVSARIAQIEAIEKTNNI